VIDSLVSTCLRYLSLLATLLIVISLHAQKICSEEVKLLLSPPQVQSAITALKARQETHGRVYFYDTPALDLLSNGVILRLRDRAEVDLTAKLRPLPGDKFVNPSGVRDDYKCEVDFNDGVATESFSVMNKYLTAKTPVTGEEIFQELSEGQKRLLRDAKVQIDWKRVKRIAEIQSTNWTSRAKPPLGKLSVELWEWSGGSILEISTRVAPDGRLAAFVELRDLANKKGLALDTNQSSKTAIALGQITAAQPQ
jgi:hypothetical protein